MENQDEIKTELITMTVSELNFNLRRLFDSRAGLRDIRIRGEISNFKRSNPSGHLYLTLKDEHSVLRACMFRREAEYLPYEPKDGMQVIARGRITVYEPNGTYQLYIDQMDPIGEGSMQQRFEQLKEKLLKEGLFDEWHKKPIPKYPKNIGVATSDTGAAICDICNIISRRYRACNVQLYPVKVQGQGAAEEIVRAIEYFNKYSVCDVLIVGRGGGSIEDLWAFNEEIVARAIAKSKIPVISAVGHEIDFTIADFAADLRAPTPSAAAELCVPDTKTLLEGLEATKLQLAQALRGKAEAARAQLMYAKNSQAMTSPEKRIADARLDVDAKMERIATKTMNFVSEQKTHLASAAGKLSALSPLGVLERGYAIVTDEKGRVVKQAKKVKVGSTVQAQVDQGTIVAEVIRTEG